MKKLIKGIVDFRRKLLPAYQEKFAELALGQSPDTLFICCSDSRVAPNVFASTDPGDLFVIRNVGNIVPECGTDGRSTADESEAAGIEFATMVLKVTDIIVCGHSECGAMMAIIEGREKLPLPHLKDWLRHGEHSLAQLDRKLTRYALHNQLSQLNVLRQLQHLQTYPVVKERIKEGKLKLHGWWFELQTASVHAYEEETNDFIVIDEAEAAKILARLS